LDEGVAAIIGLAMEIDADDVEACLLQAARCAASAAKEVERANHVSLSRFKKSVVVPSSSKSLHPLGKRLYNALPTDIIEHAVTHHAGVLDFID
jgi:hypothetical protein